MLLKAQKVCRERR